MAESSGVATFLYYETFQFANFSCEENATCNESELEEAETATVKSPINFFWERSLSLNTGIKKKGVVDCNMFSIVTVIS